MKVQIVAIIDEEAWREARDAILGTLPTDHCKTEFVEKIDAAVERVTT